MRHIESCDITVRLLEQNLWRNSGAYERKKRGLIHFPLRFEDRIWRRIMHRSVAVEFSVHE